MSKIIAVLNLIIDLSYFLDLLRHIVKTRLKYIKEKNQITLFQKDLHEKSIYFEQIQQKKRNNVGKSVFHCINVTSSKAIDINDSSNTLMLP